MKTKKYFNKYKEEDGAIIVLVALFMTIIIAFAAFVLDLGINYNENSLLQKGLDSIALAAVRELPAQSTDIIYDDNWKNAVDAAIKYAELNKIDNITESSLTPVYEDGKIIGITVQGSTEFSYNFARIFGANEGSVNKKATAKLLKVSGMSGLLPLAMPKAVMDYIISENLINEEIELKLGANKTGDITNDMIREFTEAFNIIGDMSGNQGWRGAINFIDSDYKTDMQNGGYDGIVNIGDQVYTNSGTMPVDNTGKIQVGQTAIVPVVDVDEGIVRVVGFVSFEITKLEGNNENQTHKISILTSSYLNDYITSGDAEAGVVDNDYGVRAAKLVDY